MVNTKEIKIEEYNYPLPDDRIAKFPLSERDSSKLMIYRKGEISQTYFSDITNNIPQNSIMVFNNTRVIQARLNFRKATGAAIEIFCLEPVLPADYNMAFQNKGNLVWMCMIGNLKKWKEGKLELPISVKGYEVILRAERVDSSGNTHHVRFTWDDDSYNFADILDAAGQLPIPPYLNRDTEESDKETYQTVYSKIKGSVAAPTAGLHFTENVLQGLKSKGVSCLELTLHVGAGTFQPVKSESIDGHKMHTEFIRVNRSLIESIKSQDRFLIAVGTTSVRTLESLYYIGEKLEHYPNATADEIKVLQWQPYEKEYTLSVEKALQNIIDYLDRNGIEDLLTSTQIMIAPGYTFRIVKGIVTNFHQPQSTLLLLVSCFVNGDWKSIYDYALDNDFRFLSYGDSSLLLP